MQAERTAWPALLPPAAAGWQAGGRSGRYMLPLTWLPAGSYFNPCVADWPVHELLYFEQAAQSTESA